MGCICSKGAQDENINENDNEKDFNNINNKASVQLVAPTPTQKEDFLVGRGGNNGSIRLASKASLGSVLVSVDEGDQKKSLIAERPGNGHQILPTVDTGAGVFPQMVSISSSPRGAEGELVAAGWPSWLASVAGEAAKGWLPRRMESFEKLDKVISPLQRFLLHASL